MKKTHVSLLDGRRVIVEENAAGQIRVSDVSEDRVAACELLGVNECDCRYGWVHPFPDHDQRE